MLLEESPARDRAELAARTAADVGAQAVKKLEEHSELIVNMMSCRWKSIGCGAKWPSCAVALRQMSCNTCSLSRYGVSKHSPGHEHNTVSDTSRSDSHHTETTSTETAAQARRLAVAGGPTNCGYHRHTDHLRYLATFRDTECLDVALQQDLQRSVSGAND